MHIVVSSHHLEEVERICDAVVIVEGGEVVHAGALDELSRGVEGLVVEVDERAGELASLLAARGLGDVTVDGDVLQLGSGDGMHDAVRDAVAELGIGLRRLAPRGLRSRTSTWEPARDRPGRPALRPRLPGLRRAARPPGA